MHLDLVTEDLLQDLKVGSLQEQEEEIAETIVLKADSSL
jgi:hypothetical protein